MATESKAHLFHWDSLAREKVTDQIDRRLVTGERTMLAHVYLEKGSVVPWHEHENEQFTYVLDGALRIWTGGEDGEVHDVLKGHVLHIPPGVPHKAEALEDTVDLDVFTPIRQDWLDGTDTYFHDQ